MSSNRSLIFLLSGVAALHVLIFAAAFPFFSVVDEQAHFDLATHYAAGQPPRTLVKASESARPFILFYSCPEFLTDPATQPGGIVPPPPWKISPQAAAERLASRAQFWREVAENHEASQPPLYYLLTGGCWWTSNLLGLPDGFRLYSLRFLNALFLVGLVWLGARATRLIFPENQFIQVAVPAFIALFPQRVFYSINNDVLAPLAFGLAFLMVWKVCVTDPLTPRLAVAAGLALAAAFLTKLSTLPLLAVAAMFLGGQAIIVIQRTGFSRTIALWVLLFAMALVPAAVWMSWCQNHFGDPTGSGPKIHFLGWTDQPVAEWFRHPIFSAAGLWYFVKGNLATFWQGEMLWHREPLAWPSLDIIYTLLTVVLFAALLLAWWRRPVSFSAPQRAALGLALACVFATFAFFALLSVKYDFHDCFYPSREKPFFVSGRLMLGMLLPFLLVIAAGLDQLLGKFNLRMKFAVLGVLLVLMLGTEFAVNWPVFASEYNWFHQ